MPETVYLFLDESGNFDFSANGTKYLILTSVRMQRQFTAVSGLAAYRYDCLEAGMDIEHFHCASDKWPVRNEVFDLIASDLDALHIDCLVVEKRKARPELWRGDSLRVYPWMLGHFMKRLVTEEKTAGTQKVVAITDALPHARKRTAIAKQIRSAASRRQRPGIQYCLLHHASRSHFGLQMADYCSWAIQRKWEKAELDAYDRIKPAIRSELDIFHYGTTQYY